MPRAEKKAFRAISCHTKASKTISGHLKASQTISGRVKASYKQFLAICKHPYTVDDKPLHDFTYQHPRNYASIVCIPGHAGCISSAVSFMSSFLFSATKKETTWTAENWGAFSRGKCDLAQLLSGSSVGEFQKPWFVESLYVYVVPWAPNYGILLEVQGWL